MTLTVRRACTVIRIAPPPVALGLKWTNPPLDSCLVCRAKAHFGSCERRCDLIHHESETWPFNQFLDKSQFTDPETFDYSERRLRLKSLARTYVTLLPIGIYLRLTKIHKLHTVFCSQGLCRKDAGQGCQQDLSSWHLVSNCGVDCLK